MALDHSREAARLKRRRDELRLELATVQRELEATLTLAGEELIEAGIPRLPIDGSIVYFRTVATIRPRCQRDGEPLPPRGKLPTEMRAALHRALARLGLSDLMPWQLNTRAMQAWLVEQIEAGEPIPAELNRWLEIDTRRIAAIMADSTAAIMADRTAARVLDDALGEGRLE